MKIISACVSVTSLVFLFAFVFVGLIPAAPRLPQRLTARNSTFEASISPDGAYRLNVLSPDWALEGKLSKPVAHLRSATGSDKIGPYHALNATYQNGARSAEIRVYDALPLVLLRDTWNSSAPNESPFPAFRRLPADLFRFSYQHQAFGEYEFGSLGSDGPSTLFDKLGNVLLLSPADHFLISQMSELSGGGVNSRILDAIQTLPAGFTHGTLIAFGKGMNATFAAWGRALLALSGKRPPSNESGVILSKLGYWTDNGAVYYYHFEPQLGYTGTLLAVRDEFKKLGIPLGYVQLDSWWYPKGTDGLWNSAGGALPFGEYLYRADKTLFLDGLAGFQKSLGLPIVTHARWISPASPYHQQYKMSANVILDPAFWKSTAAYLHDAGDVTFEQDWLNHNALPELNLEDTQAFLGNMSSSMSAVGMNIQYCMPLPAHYMASTLYPNVETIRTSDDRLTPKKWDEFLYDSRLAAAVGLWPWTDVFMSKELPNLILSTLSAGPVGVGDALGSVNAQNLMAVIRPDGFIIKPDFPVLPIDAMYASDAAKQQAPMVAMATTKFAGTAIRYVFSYPRRPADSEASVALGDLGLSGPAYAYDWIAHSGSLVPAGGALLMHFKDGFAYNVLVPVNHEGLALLGETGKIVPLGRQRIASLEDRGALTAAIQFAPGETSITISGYAAYRPKLAALEGTLKSSSYDQQTGIFQALLAPAAFRQAVLRVTAH